MSDRIVANRAGLPWHPQYLEDLEIKPAKARIYRIDDDGYLDEEPWLWQLDGYAVVDGQFAVTSTVWNFPTFTEAIAGVPEFEEAFR
jgi:hypothetical protein